MENYEALRAELIRLHRQYPNNMQFGEAVRKLLWQMMEQRSEAINAAQLPGQLTIDDALNENKS